MNSRKKPTRILRLFDDSDSDQDIGKCITEIIENEINKFMETFVIEYGQFSENSRECTPNIFSSNNMDLSTSSSSDSEDSNGINISNGIDETTTWWHTAEIQDFYFDWSSMGVADDLKNCKTPKEIFGKIWSTEIMYLIVGCTNEYGKNLLSLSRPRTRNCRTKSFTETNFQEMEIFFGLCLLQAQIKTPKICSNWSNNPLYYHPIFGASMTGRSSTAAEQLKKKDTCLRAAFIAVGCRTNALKFEAFTTRCVCLGE
uniref:DDE_Tnp_1_7 domain-containing protein n=1 Tax=Glossina pallidipes TaxID=7398 RepID=A0A1A9ZCN1_GLOPL